ncbi:MAG: hypothetical protein NVS3B3_19850 [Aquirhabdus sp.]
MKASLRTFAGVILCASTWQLAQAIPQHTEPTTAKSLPYRALSVHDKKWYKAHPNYKPSAKRGWIKNLPHRYRIVKVHNQTYYYSHNQYYQRSGNGYVAVRIPFARR